MDAKRPSFERQVIRAAQRLGFGKRVKNPLLDACAEVMLQDFKPDHKLPNCSNGANHYSCFVPASEPKEKP